MSIPYRHRRTLKRVGTLLAALLLVFTVTWLCWVIWLQRYVVYTDDGAQLNFEMSSHDIVGEVATPPEAAKNISIYYNEGDDAIDIGNDMKQLNGYYIDSDMLQKDMTGVLVRVEQLSAGTPILIDMKDPYGILPMPKYDESQKTYLTNAWDQFSVFGVPLTLSDADKDVTGIIFEALCAESYKTVFPAYYDQALKSRYSAEPATAEIIDIIMAGRKLEFTFQFGENLSALPYMFRQMLGKNSTDVASTFKKQQKALNKVVQRLIDVYMEG